MPVLKCTICTKDIPDSRFRRRLASDPHVLTFLTSVAMIASCLLLDDTASNTTSKYVCRDCFRQLEKAVRSVNFLNPLIVAVRKSFGMPHNVSLAARSAEIVDTGRQSTCKASSTPLRESEESTNGSSDTEQGCHGVVLLYALSNTCTQI